MPSRIGVVLAARSAPHRCECPDSVSPAHFESTRDGGECAESPNGFPRGSSPDPRTMHVRVMLGTGRSRISRTMTNSEHRHQRRRRHPESIRGIRSTCPLEYLVPPIGIHRRWEGRTYRWSQMPQKILAALADQASGFRPPDGERRGQLTGLSGSVIEAFSLCWASCSATNHPRRGHGEPHL